MLLAMGSLEVAAAEDVAEAAGAAAITSTRCARKDRANNDDFFLADSSP